MAMRRCLQVLTRQAHTTTTTFLSTNQSSLHSLSVTPFQNATVSSPIFTNSRPSSAFAQWSHLRYFSSTEQHNDHIIKEDSITEDEGEEEEDDDDDDDEDYVTVSSGKKVYSAEEKEAEATAIGYKVVGPLHEKDQVFKRYEPVFAVVQIGSHQFKVSNGDSIFTERLKFCEVNDKLILNKVLLLGSPSQTIVGRPIVPDAAVHAVVEEHALDAKVIIFKKKRRKNYRRTKGHRQELTKLRITDIQGIEKPTNILVEKPSKAAMKEQEKVPVTS